MPTRPTPAPGDTAAPHERGRGQRLTALRYGAVALCFGVLALLDTVGVVEAGTATVVLSWLAAGGFAHLAVRSWKLAGDG